MKTDGPFSLLIKPASADCNARCAYCFYREKSALYPDTARHRMPRHVLDRVVSSYMATDQPVYSFGWQGGEPTLMGLEFFRQVVGLQQEHGRAGSLVANGLQTNGLLVDDAWAAFLAEYRFLVGISLDGPRDLHDAARRGSGGEGTHDRVLRGVATLARHRVSVNSLTAVTSSHRGRGSEVYRSLVDHGFAYHQYIPIVEFDASGAPRPFSIRPEDWGEFLCQVFDEWETSDTTSVSVRQFDAILAQLVDGEAPLCTMGRECRQYFMVEHNGDVYPCDFYAEPGLRLGTILDTDWAEMQESPTRLRFARAKSQLTDDCLVCPYLGLCQGDCPRNRVPYAPESRRRSWLCAGWKMFYEHSLNRLQRLARVVQANRAREPRAAQVQGGTA